MSNNIRIILLLLSLFLIVLIIGKKYAENTRVYESFFVEEGPSPVSTPTTSSDKPPSPPSQPTPPPPSQPTPPAPPSPAPPSPAPPAPTLTVEKNTNEKLHTILSNEETKKMKFVIEKIFSGIGKMASNSLSEEGVVPASVKNESFQTMCTSKPASYN
jgi:type IV secretory pathway VirB10-like protein